jgi:hypothetical protein
VTYRAVGPGLVDVLAILEHGFSVFSGPVGEHPDGFIEGVAERGEFVFDARRCFGISVTLDEPVGLEAPECLREDFAEMPPISSTRAPWRWGPSWSANSVTAAHLSDRISIAARAGQSARKTVPAMRVTPERYQEVPIVSVAFLACSSESFPSLT